MKIWYGVQSTGLGHLIPYQSLAGALQKLSHEIVTLTSGPTPPSFFKPIGHKYTHVNGPTLIMDHQALSYLKTTYYNTVHASEFLKNYFRIKKLIKEEKPDLIIEDYEPYTSNYIRWMKPRIPSFSVDHQSIFVSPMFPYKVDGLLKLISHVFTHAKIRLCSSFFDYGAKDAFFSNPPLLREEVLNTAPGDDGSILVYHSSATTADKSEIKRKCPKDGQFIFYGYDEEVYGNLIFKPKGSDFLRDLAKCHIYVTHCGFFSVCEAMVLGKRIVCQPLHGHLEQEWNGRMLQNFPSVKIVDSLDYSGLLKLDLAKPDPNEIAWLRNGLSMAVQKILSISTSK